jgi:hypothetical protein
MDEFVKASSVDAASLGDLYARGFEKTGFKKIAPLEKRHELVEWLEGICRKDEIWFRRDQAGPIVLGHYSLQSDEVTLVVTRDGEERRGHGAAMLNGLLARHPTAKIRPVNNAGRALAKTCDFSPSVDDKSIWVRTPTG